jgi:hypothetical protein
MRLLDTRKDPEAQQGAVRPMDLTAAMAKGLYLIPLI